jgi:hypothetical protein
VQASNQFFKTEYVIIDVIKIQCSAFAGLALNAAQRCVVDKDEAICCYHALKSEISVLTTFDTNHSAACTPFFRLFSLLPSTGFKNCPVQERATP